MEIDTCKIDTAVLALLCLSLDCSGRSWKGFDGKSPGRLHAKMLIEDPVNKAKPVTPTLQGQAEAERLSR